MTKQERKLELEKLVIQTIKLLKQIDRTYPSREVEALVPKLEAALMGREK